MIFVGSGSLLSHAVGHALRNDRDVRLVCCPVGDSSIPKLSRLNVRVMESCDPSADLLPILSTGKEQKVFSINNKYILKDDLLAAGPDFFNIHNGLVQKYRGISEVCIFSALCSGDVQYGVTLHKLLPGERVDAGPVVDQMVFGIEGWTFANVMTRSLDACREIFEINLLSIIQDRYDASYPDQLGSSYSYKSVPQICASADPASLARASDLGAYAAFFPRLVDLIRSSRGVSQAAG